MILPTQKQIDDISMKYCGDQCVDHAMEDLINLIIELNKETK